MKTSLEICHSYNYLLRLVLNFFSWMWCNDEKVFIWWQGGLLSLYTDLSWLLITHRLLMADSSAPRSPSNSYLFCSAGHLFPNPLKWPNYCIHWCISFYLTSQPNSYPVKLLTIALLLTHHEVYVCKQDWLLCAHGLSSEDTPKISALEYFSVFPQ